MMVDDDAVQPLAVLFVPPMTVLANTLDHLTEPPVDHTPQLLVVAQMEGVLDSS